MESSFHDRVRRFYRRLLRLYPKAFYDRFGESMEQTFNDLCREEKRPLLFTFRTSMDTAFGAACEQFRDQFGGRTMQSITTYQKFAAIAGVLLVIPGALMISLLVFGIEPPIGALEQYIRPTDPDAPHVLGTLIVLTIVLILPLIGLLISAQAFENEQFKLLRTDVLKSVVFGLFLVAPLIVLEMTFGRANYSSFPTALFGILWVLPTLFAFVALPLYRAFRDTAENRPMIATIVIRVVFMGVIALFWFGLVNDQMPCFLGVPNCD